MKRFVLLVLLVLPFLVTSVHSQDVNLGLAWDDPNGVEANVIEYKLYHSTDGATFNLLQTVPIVSGQVATVTFQQNSGLHHYYVTAVNHIAESGPSNTLVVVSFAASTPVDLRIGAVNQGVSP